MDKITHLISQATAARAAVADKQQAFDQIVRRFQDLAFACAYSVLGDFGLAEDAAQEAFLTAWRHLDQLRTPEAFPACSGTRYNAETLEVRLNGKNIADILDFSLEEAAAFFSESSLIRHKLAVLNQLGLGYLKMGQSATTQSGGEAQRVKLAYELGKIKRGGRNFYILDEPTTGLHLADIQRLLDSLQRLVAVGNTVLVIEHHLDVIKTAD